MAHWFSWLVPQAVSNLWNYSAAQATPSGAPHSSSSPPPPNLSTIAKPVPPSSQHHHHAPTSLKPPSTLNPPLLSTDLSQTQQHRRKYTRQPTSLRSTLANLNSTATQAPLLEAPHCSPHSHSHNPSPNFTFFYPSMPNMKDDSDTSEADDDMPLPSHPTRVCRDAPNLFNPQAPPGPTAALSAASRLHMQDPPVTTNLSSLSSFSLKPQQLQQQYSPSPSDHFQAPSDNFQEEYQPASLRRALDDSHHSSQAFTTSDSPCDAPPTTKPQSRRRYTNVAPPSPRHNHPAIPFSFRDWCNIPSAPPPSACQESPDCPLASIFIAADTSACFDGSFSPETRRMGTSFIAHHHHLHCTHVNSRGHTNHEDNTSMLAEALAFQDLLSDALASNSKSIHITGDSKTLIKLGLGKDTSLGPEYNTTSFCKATNDIVRMLKIFETVHISHVRSHKKWLKENDVVDLLAGISCNDPLFSLCENVSALNHNSLLSHVLKQRKPRSCDRISSIPFISESQPAHSACPVCKCPSHDRSSCCFVNHAECFPIHSIHCKLQPTRPSAFIDQVSNPALINWDSAPTSMGGDYFVRFIAICINNLRQPDRYHAALHALHMFAKTYILIRGHISRKKTRPPRDTSSVELPPNHDSRLARDAQTAAEHARNLNYHDAIKVLNRDEPIGPLHPSATAQLLRLYPDRIQDPLIPPSAPITGRQLFDRNIIWSYVKSRSVTSSAGISGFGFNFIQHFARLTAGHETPEDADANWTIFVAFIEDLSCGSLTWLRSWATCLKGSLFNKTGDINNIKLRNLGIAETLVRVAAYMVCRTATPLARDAGFIGDFDLGVGVPGGTEKFVKLNQLAADAGLTIFGADLEKAFNSMKRSDIWAAVQNLNCPLLTSWFCFFFHQPPVVLFSADPRSSFNVSNTIQYTLWEGVAQGDPCSSLLFVITLSFILRDFKSHHPGIVLATVIDDTSLIFPDTLSPTLPTVTAELVSILTAHNLPVNTDKTVVYKEGAFDFDTASVPYSLSHDRFVVCRRSIGSRSAVSDDAFSIIEDINKTKLFYLRLHSALSTCRTPGRGLIFMDILRLSFRSRYQWGMRTLTPPAASRVAVAADSALLQLLSLVLPHHPSFTLPPLWSHLKTLHTIKLSLPLKQGGLGMRSWSSLRHITHFSSWAEAGPRALLLMTRLNFTLPASVSRDIGDSVSALHSRLKNPPSFWQFGTAVKRFKLQHVLTNQLDDFETLLGSSLSHDPAVNAQFIGSCLPHMCLPFNASAVPRSDLHGCDESLFPYALAFHTLMPLFPPALCECGEHVDPLGLHYASCIKINSRNLLHNALRDCFYGALHHILRDLPSHNVALLISDKMSKSSTYIHHWYPLKDNAPVIHERQAPYGSRPSLIAPSKSPDILVAFFNAPHRPLFGDFVFSSPRTSDRTSHSQAAQVACNSKHSDYSKHHSYPDDVFFPLAAERSGYVHPTFIGFIETFLAQCSISPLLPSAKLGVLYSIAHAVTYMTASFLKVASFSLTPSSLKSLFPPPPFIPPLRWAPGHLFHAPRHRSFGSASHSSGHSRRRASSKALAVHSPTHTSRAGVDVVSGPP